MSCGGQGFSDYAGISPLWRHQVLIPTVEGENTMIILQTARFLVKNFGHAFKGNKSISKYTSYFKEFSTILSEKIDHVEIKDIVEPQFLNKILIFLVTYQTSQSVQLMMAKQKQGISMKDSWDLHAGQGLIESAMIFIHQLSYQTLLEKINTISDENT
jgi:hypothetical protein